MLVGLVVAFSGDTDFPTSFGTPGPSAGRWFAGGGGGAGGTPPGQGGLNAPGGAGGVVMDQMLTGGEGNATANTGGGGGSSNIQGGGGAGGGGARSFNCHRTITDTTYPLLLEQVLQHLKPPLVVVRKKGPMGLVMRISAPV